MSNNLSDLITLGHSTSSPKVTRENLGNKGFILNEMIRELGLPVPPGFVIPVELCQIALKEGWPEYLNKQIQVKILELEQSTGQTLGDPASPLIVSVRSGAAVSMPGMMDTILNVGLTPALVDSIERMTGDPLFAADTWLRFTSSYAALVLELDQKVLVPLSRSNDSVTGMLQAAENISRYARDNSETGIPGDPLEQIIGAIKAVFRSWESDRALAYRSKENLSNVAGTAAIIQKMVFGNLDMRSGSGVVFSRDPLTGANRPSGDYVIRGQGEDVVAGGTAVSNLKALEDQNVKIYSELLEIIRMLEHHYRDMCDVEFTVEKGELYILQNRVGKRSAAAAIKIAVDMGTDTDFPLTQLEAAHRVSEEQIQEVQKIRGVITDDFPLASGIPASSGVGSGELCLSVERAIQCRKKNRPFVLARQETSPNDIPGIIGAQGLITMLGGMASHAAVVARSWGIPAVTSLQKANLTDDGFMLQSILVPEGTTITVDGSRGEIFLGDLPTTINEIPLELQTLLDWKATEGARGSSEIKLFELAASPESTVAVLKIVKLKGMCTSDQISQALLVSDKDSTKVISNCGEFLEKVGDYYSLGDVGRELLLNDLSEKQVLIPIADLEQLHQQFLELDSEFKSLVTDWQLTQEKNESDLKELHSRLEIITTETSSGLIQLENIDKTFRRYVPLFEIALDGIRDGDSSMIASPLKDSYHTLWFELHQELIDLTGISRADLEK